MVTGGSPVFKTLRKSQKRDDKEKFALPSSNEWLNKWIFLYPYRSNNIVQNKW
jgi:hypothetical protein